MIEVMAHLLYLLRNTALFVLISTIFSFVYAMELDDIPIEPLRSKIPTYDSVRKNLVHSLQTSFDEKISGKKCTEVDAYLFSNIRWSKQKEYADIVNTISLSKEEKQKKYIKENIFKSLQKKFLTLLESNLISFDIVQLFGMNSFSNQTEYLSMLNGISNEIIFLNQKVNKAFKSAEEKEGFCNHCIRNRMQSQIKKDLDEGLLTEKGLQTFGSIALDKQNLVTYNKIKENPFQNIPHDDLKQTKKAEILAHKENILSNMTAIRNSLQSCISLAYEEGKISITDLELFQSIHFEKQHDFYPMLLEGTIKQHKCLEEKNEISIQSLDTSVIPNFRFGLNTGIFSQEDLDIFKQCSVMEQQKLYHTLFRHKFLSHLALSESLFDNQCVFPKVPASQENEENTSSPAAISIHSLDMSQETSAQSKQPSKNQRKRLARKKRKEEELRAEMVSATSNSKETELASTPIQDTITASTFVLQESILPPKPKQKTIIPPITGVTTKIIRISNLPLNTDHKIRTKMLLIPHERNFDQKPLAEVFSLKSGPAKVDYEIVNDTWNVSRGQMGNYFVALWCKFEKNKAKGNHYKISLPILCEVHSKNTILLTIKNENGGALTLSEWEQSYRDKKPLQYLQDEILVARGKLRAFYNTIMTTCDNEGIDTKSEKNKIDLLLKY